MEKSNGMVSVCIACYNHQRYVRSCLESILVQEYPLFEVIICDDASQDSSVEEIKVMVPLFEKRNITFRLVENEVNQGLTKNLNKMLSMAQGEYIKIISSDDMLRQDYLFKMVEVLRQDSSLKYAFSNCMRVSDKAAFPVKMEEMLGVVLEEIPDYKNNIVEKIFVNNFILAPSMIFRKSVLDEMGGYDENIGIEDLEMSLRILSKYPNGLGVIEECLVYYRISEDSMSSGALNKNAGKRMKYMYDNCVAIAKKHRGLVSNKIYHIRMRSLKHTYFF